MFDLLTVGPKLRGLRVARRQQLAPDLSSKPGSYRCRYRSTEQTDGRTLDRFMTLIAYSAHHVTKLLYIEPARSKMGDIRGFTVSVCSQPRAPTQPPILSGPEMFDLTSSRYSSPPSVVTATRSVAYIFLIPSHWLFLSIRVTLSLKSTSSTSVGLCHSAVNNN